MSGRESEQSATDGRSILSSLLESFAAPPADLNDHQLSTANYQLDTRQQPQQPQQQVNVEKEGQDNQIGLAFVPLQPQSYSPVGGPAGTTGAGASMPGARGFLVSQQPVIKFPIPQLRQKEKTTLKFTSSSVSTLPVGNGGLGLNGDNEAGAGLSQDAQSSKLVSFSIFFFFSSFFLFFFFSF